MKDIENISSYVFYLNKGDKIPLKMTLNSELLDIANEEINLILKQKVYFRLRIPEGINIEALIQKGGLYTLISKLLNKHLG